MEKLINSLQLPSPIQSFQFTEFPNRQILIKRDDLIHPLVSGNKWRKLKYNIQHAKENGYKGIISLGGAFSNHLYAVAAACKIEGLLCKAYVRGDGMDKYNPTLKFLHEQGAELTFLDRTTYKKRHELDFLESIAQQFPDYYLVPEGGSNDLAVLGVTELMNEVYQENDYGKLLVVCGVGSGSMITGIVKGLRDTDNALGILTVNDASLSNKISSKLSHIENQKLRLELNAHFGGFGKTKAELIKFINEFYSRTKIPLEPLYTGKVLYCLRSMLREGNLYEYDNILVVHSGGLQGNKGFDYRFPGKLAKDLVNNS